MASTQSSEMTDSRPDSILSYAGEHCLFVFFPSPPIAASPPVSSFSLWSNRPLVSTSKYCCLQILEFDTYYCLSEAIAEIERILNPYGKIAYKLRFVAVVLYKTTKVTASKVGHTSATVMSQD